MPTNCVKVVQKTAQKYVQNTWNLVVEKIEKVDKYFRFNSFTQVINKNSGVLPIFIDRFYTQFFSYSSLLFEGFTPFPHRTTITTTLLNNKDKNF